MCGSIPHDQLNRVSSAALLGRQTDMYKIVFDIEPWDDPNPIRRTNRRSNQDPTLF
jgi:hypothetical protein